MRFGEVFFSLQDADRAAQTPVTASMFARATFEGIKALCVFREFYLRPLVQAILKPSAREQAVIMLHLRSAGLLASIRRLDGPAHFQSVAAAARALFEVSLDMALLNKDSSSESVERLEAFTRVERFRAAEKLVKFYNSHPIPPDLSLTTRQDVVVDPTEQAAIDKYRDKFWGAEKKKGRWPRHWSTFPKLDERAKNVGPEWEERYVRHYPGLSWHVHAGLVGVDGLSKDSFEIMLSEAHRLAVDTGLQSYSTLGRELHISKGMPEWAERMNFLDRVIAQELVDQRLQAKGEPKRFLYLEDHELPAA